MLNDGTVVVTLGEKGGLEKAMIDAANSRPMSGGYESCSARNVGIAYPDPPKPENIKVTAIIQARMGSERFPGKVLESIYKKTSMLEFMLSRLMYSYLIDHIIVATSIVKEDDAIEKVVTSFQGWQHDTTVSIYRGAVNDVLSRYFYAARSISTDSHNFVIRLTGDCPLVDPILIDRMILNALDSRHHFTVDKSFLSNAIPGLRSFPVGMDVEIMSFATLKWLFEVASTPQETEHVTQLIYDLISGYLKDLRDMENPEKYSVSDTEYYPRERSLEAFNGRTNHSYSAIIKYMSYHLIDSKGGINYAYKDYKWAVDTVEDLMHVRELVSLVYPKNERFTCFDLLTAEEQLKTTNTV